MKKLFFVFAIAALASCNSGSDTEKSTETSAPASTETVAPASTDNAAPATSTPASTDAPATTATTK